MIIMNPDYNETTHSQRDFIVRRATMMFVEQGVKEVRMDDIAHELAISKRTLYEVFADKRSLLEACLAHNIEQMNEAISQTVAHANNVVEEIFMMVRGAYRRNQQYRGFMHSMAKYYPDILEPYKERQSRAGSALFHSLLQRGLGEDVFKADMNVALAEMIFTMALNGLVSSAQLNLPSGVTMQDAVIYFIVNFFRGLATEKGMRMVDEYVNDEYAHLFGTK
jgi:AcrR family transcriptional regulator